MQAFYDSKPSVLEAVGNGSYLYRTDIKEVETDSNAAQLGLYSDETEAEAKVTRYTDYLTERAALKAQIDADCAGLGIK